MDLIISHTFVGFLFVICICLMLLNMFEEDPEWYEIRQIFDYGHNLPNPKIVPSWATEIYGPHI